MSMGVFTPSQCLFWSLVYFSHSVVCLGIYEHSQHAWIHTKTVFELVYCGENEIQPNGPMKQAVS